MHKQTTKIIIEEKDVMDLLIVGKLILQGALTFTSSLAKDLNNMSFVPGHRKTNLPKR